MKKRFSILSVVAIAAAFTLTACGSSDSSTSAAASCDKADLATVTDGKLTIATGEPAYYPWIIDDAPETGNGFEGAVAYAVAKELGFDAADVTWVRTTFDSAVTPGEKNFDFNLQQFSISPEREKTVSFSTPYYSTNQAVVGLAGSAAAGAKTIADLKDVKFGAQSGTTSLDFITNVLKPDAEPFAYDDNAGAKAALEANQIDAIVVDLPTAFYIAAVEIEGASVIGQFAADAAGTSDQFGLVFDLENPLVSCVNTALATLKDNGTLAAIEKTWLADKTNAPVIAAS